MAILITSPGLVTTGTEGADNILFGTGLATGNATVVDGLAGNDTIVGSNIGQFSAANIGAGPVFNGGGGADVLTFTGGISGGTTSATNAVLNGGAGRDTITLSGTDSGLIGNVAGADGGDLITLVGTGIYSAIGGGAGLDTIELSGVTTLATGATIGAGAGNDVISGAVTTLTGAGVLGGGGSDTITLNSIIGTGSFVNGDTTTNGGLADSIAVNTMAAGTIIRGKGGADTINVANTLGSAVIAGNAGGDVLVLSGTVADDFAVQAGQGGDSITLDEADLTNVSGILLAGGGNDTILIADVIVNNSTISMNGGAGVDSITFSGVLSDLNLGTLEISDLGDSKGGAMDTVDLTGIAAGETGTLTFAASTSLSLGSAGALSAIADVAFTGATTTGFFTAAGQSGTVTSGAMSFSGQGSATVASAMVHADAVTLIGTDTTKAGKSVLFTAGADEYLFIQGGATGTSDDYVVKFNGTSGSTMTGTTMLLEGDV